jgi:hypothetical protein
MELRTVDITQYLETRRRMRLLPNLLDRGIAYGIFCPVANLPASLGPLAHLSNTSLSSWLYHYFTTDPIGFVLGALAYAVYALVQATFKSVVGIKLKTLVLSDSSVTIWILVVYASILLLFTPVLASTVSPRLFTGYRNSRYIVIRVFIVICSFLKA